MFNINYSLMKTKKISYSIIYVLFLTCAIFFSCSNEEDKLTIPENSANSNYIPDPIKIPSQTLEWDESYHPNDVMTKATVNHSHEMAVTSTNIFVGGPYTANSVETLDFKFIPNQLKPIEVAYTFPRYYFDRIEVPSITGMYRSMNKAIESPSFTGKQSLSFEYDFREFSYYRELKLAFGANVDIASVFKLESSVNSTKIRSKSGLFARVVQKNFSLIMDYPTNGNIFLKESDLSGLLSQSPVYINSIILGRMGIIAIESSYSYDELKIAFKAALTAGKINGELNISSDYKKILNESTIRIFVSGGNGQDVAKIVEGYNEFKNFIINGGEFTRDIPGVPIFFTANYASDNSVFRTSFVTE